MSGFHCVRCGRWRASWLDAYQYVSRHHRLVKPVCPHCHRLATMPRWRAPWKIARVIR